MSGFQRFAGETEAAAFERLCTPPFVTNDEPRRAAAATTRRSALDRLERGLAEARAIIERGRQRIAEGVYLDPYRHLNGRHEMEKREIVAMFVTMGGQVPGRVPAET
jgi:hypothetical protein